MIQYLNFSFTIVFITKQCKEQPLGTGMGLLTVRE